MIIAINRAKWSILSIGLVYAVFVLSGIGFVQSGNSAALNERDSLVNRSMKQDQASIQYNQGNNLQAALIDFSGNLFLGALPETLMGFGIVFPYPFAAYQGWVGGIVSVRGDHSSRFNDPRSALYYLITLLLQLFPYSLAIGGGVNVGISLFHPRSYYVGQKILKLIPKEALLDLARIYSIVIPLFLAASLWEFLSPLNI